METTTSIYKQNKTNLTQTKTLIKQKKLERERIPF